MTLARLIIVVVALSGVRPVSAQTQQTTGNVAEQKAVVSHSSSAKLRPKQVLLLSALVPGAGQIHNRMYWKLPLAYGAMGGVGYGLYQSQVRYREYVVAKRALQAGKTIPELSGKLVTQEKNTSGVAAGLQRYRTQRDLFIGYMAVTYSMVALDAFVDAHLREFDVSENLAVRLTPSASPVAVGGMAPGLRLQLHVKSRAFTSAL